MAGNVFSSIALSSSSGGSAPSCEIALRYGSSYSFVIAKKKTSSGSLRRKSALSRNRKTPITLSLILSTYPRSNDFLSASPHSKFRTETCSVSCSILPQLRFMTLISLSAAESIPKLNLLSCNSASVPSSKRCTRFGKSSIHRLRDPAS